MPPLAAQVSPRKADDAKERGFCAVALPWAVLDLHEMLDAATENPATPAASAPATDELLSQLAGKEIDRLLANAGVEPATTTAEAHDSSGLADPVSAANDVAMTATAAVVADAAVPLPTDATAALINQELDQIVARQLSEAVLGNDKPIAAAPVEIPISAPQEAKARSDSADVSDLLNRLDAGERPAMPAPAAQLPEPQQTVAEKQAPEKHASEKPAPEATSEEATAESPDEITIPAGEPRGPTLATRVLDLVTLPLDPFPPQMRDAVGKIAIVTTLNALAVLIYVTFFRK